MKRFQFLKSKSIFYAEVLLSFKLLFLVFFIVLIGNIDSYAQDNQVFKVVIDPGHGGKDPGAQGYGLNEKDVALKVSLMIDEILSKHRDIELTYTRRSDEFIGLRDRATIANKANADLFISIHCNSVANKNPYGAETFVLGLHRNDDNLKIAMRENKVIELEENYMEKYDGFDPSSPESYIGFSIMQEQYLDQSILLADHIQKNFTTSLKRNNRGVKQAGFLVLRETYMPSVLVELGFLSNKRENDFLRTTINQKKYANEISRAIIKYKEALETNKDYSSSKDKILKDEVKKETKETKETKNSDLYKSTFYVQISAGSKKLKLAPYNFKGLENVSRIKESGLFKYRYGMTNSLSEIQDHLITAKEKGFKGAYIVAYLDGKKISMEEALKTQIK